MIGSNENLETYKDSKENPMYLKGYYDTSHDIKWKKQNTAVYMRAIETFTPNSNLLGIQYWFYYPFHDDPGEPSLDRPNPHPYDWWYFWVVYDMNAKQPTTAYYDFHHNVRDIAWGDFQTEGATAGSTGFHPVVFVEAGGHRHLWGVVEHTTEPQYDTENRVYVRAREITTDPIFDIMIAGLSSGNVIPFRLDASLIGWPYQWNDVTYSAPLGMKSLKEKLKEANPNDVLVGWRALHATFNVDVDVSGRVPDTSNFRLNVERESDMKNWVWIATDDPELDKIDTTKYKVTYSMSGQWYIDNLWPRYDGVTNTHSPWDEEIGTTNTVYEAWTSGAVRGEEYYNPNAGELARLLGDV